MRRDVDAEALADELGRLVQRLARVGVSGDPPVTLTQRLALAEIVRSGPLRLGRLADWIGVPDATASRAVDALVEAGLVSRRDDPADRRAVLLSATAAGRRRLEARRRLVAGYLAAALEELPAADRRRLLDSLRRLNRGLS